MFSLSQGRTPFFDLGSEPRVGCLHVIMAFPKICFDCARAAQTSRSLYFTTLQLCLEGVSQEGVSQERVTQETASLGKVSLETWTRTR